MLHHTVRKPLIVPFFFFFLLQRHLESPKENHAGECAAVKVCWPIESE